MSINIKAVKPCIDSSGEYDEYNQMSKVEEEVKEMRDASFEPGQKGRAHLAEETADALVAIFTFFCASFTYEEMVKAVELVSAKNFLRHYGDVRDYLPSGDCRGEIQVPTLLLSSSKMITDADGRSDDTRKGHVSLSFDGKADTTKS